MDGLDSPERVEQHRRSVAMLPPGAPALKREDALEVLRALVAALLEVRHRSDQAAPTDSAPPGSEVP